jgi:hypothetical protein
MVSDIFNVTEGYQRMLHRSDVVSSAHRRFAWMIKGIGGVLAGAMVSMWLYPKGRFANVSVAESAWGFGQFTAIFGLLVVGGQAWHYYVSPSLTSMPTWNPYYESFQESAVFPLKLTRNFPGIRRVSDASVPEEPLHLNEIYLPFKY